MSPPTAGDTCAERWKIDAEDSQRSQVKPASRMTPSWTPLIRSTRSGQVRTCGKGHPGTTRSRTKQKAKTARMVVSTVGYSDCLHAGLQDLTPLPLLLFSLVWFFQQRSELCDQVTVRSIKRSLGNPRVALKVFEH